MNSQSDPVAARNLVRSARNSVICGIVMLAGWAIPFVGAPLGAFGLVMGVTGLPSRRRDLARSGIFLNSLGLALTALNMFLSYYLLTTGKLDPLLNFYR
ncbi:MAG: hypothetical protein GX883_05875 [Firmicutes bacterium]|nr:hypothetical protein [Bacillota bacterium]